MNVPSLLAIAPRCVPRIAIEARGRDSPVALLFIEPDS